MAAPKDTATAAASSSITTHIASAVNNGNFDTNQMMNVAISAYMMNLAGGLNSKTFKPSMIIILLLLISLTEIKSSISDIIKAIKQHLPVLAMTLIRRLIRSTKIFLSYLNPVRLLIKLNPLKRQKLIEPIQEIENINKTTQITVKIEPNLYNLTAIHQYCLLNGIGEHEKRFEFHSKSLTDYLYEIEYNDLNFEIDRFIKGDGFSSPNGLSMAPLEYDVSSQKENGNHTIPVEGWYCGLSSPSSKRMENGNRFTFGEGLSSSPLARNGDDITVRLMNNLMVTYDVENNVKTFKIDKISLEQIIALKSKSKTDFKIELRPQFVGNATKSIKDKIFEKVNQYDSDDLNPKCRTLFKMVENKTIDDKAMFCYQDPSTINPDLCKILLSYITEHMMAANNDGGFEKFVWHHHDITYTNNAIAQYLSIVYLVSAIQDTYTSDSLFYLRIEKEHLCLYETYDDAAITKRYFISKYKYLTKFISDASQTINLSINNFNIKDYIGEQPTDLKLQFHISSPSPVTYKELYDKFTWFYQNKILISTEKKDNSDITVYAIKFNKIEKEISNPLFKEWQEKIDNINRIAESNALPVKDKKQNDENAQLEKQPISPVMMNQLMKLHDQMPQKTIKDITTKFELECVVVNKVYKKLETLYVRETDKKILINMLDKFKNKKQLYMDLGIPYKLGMLFHGHPGTGKTTAIKAAASYLCKDIYFVHLKNVKTNRDLKEVFDHINHKCNGGIIVLEDIDAATNVVHRRFEKVDLQRQIESCSSGSGSGSNVHSLTDSLSEDDDALTLSYLLNMMDGTLCNDGTIFAITTNHLDRLDPALYRKGRVDICIEFKLCDHYQIREIYKAIMGRVISEDVVAKIPEDTYAPCEIIFHVYQYLLNDFFSDEEIMKQFMI